MQVTVPNLPITGARPWERSERTAAVRVATEVSNDALDLANDIASDLEIDTDVKAALNNRFLHPHRELLNRVRILNAQISKPVVINQATQLRSLIKLEKVRFDDDHFTRFRSLARQFSGGSIDYEIALLDALYEGNLEDHELHKLGYSKDAMLSFVKRYERTFTALLEIDDIAKQHASEGATEFELKGFYERAVVNSNSVLQALGKLVPRLENDRLFLQTACAKDLAGIDLGADKVLLSLLLSELKGLKILAMIDDGVKKLVQTRLQGKDDGVLQTTFDYIEQPVTVYEVIAKWIAAATLPEQILFLQDYRNLYNRIPTEAFVSSEQQNQCKSYLQQHIDPLVFAEE